MHERTFEKMMKNAQDYEIGVAKKKDRAMLPIQYPVPKEIHQNSMKDECMDRLNWKIEMKERKNMSGFHIYEYYRDALNPSLNQDVFTIAPVNLQPLEPVACILYGWTQQPYNSSAFGGDIFKFAEIELEKVSCTTGFMQCTFRPKVRFMGTVCSNDLGLPIVCGSQLKVSYIVGPPLPPGGCQLFGGPRGEFTGYHVGYIIKS